MSVEHLCVTRAASVQTYLSHHSAIWFNSSSLLAHPCLTKDKITRIDRPQGCIYSPMNNCCATKRLPSLLLPPWKLCHNLPNVKCLHWSCERVCVYVPSHQGISFMKCQSCDRYCFLSPSAGASKDESKLFVNKSQYY